AVDDSATTLQEDPVDINVLANDSDPDGDALAVEEVGMAAHGEISINPDGTVRYVPDEGFSGLDTFTYTVTDGHGGTDVATVTVDVTSRNQPPSVDAGPDQTITFPIDTVTLSGTVSDDGLPVGSVLTISWTQVDGPAAVDFGTPDQPETTARFSVAGDYVLRLTASDGEFTVSDDVNVQVLPPADVELSVSDAVVVEGHDGMVEASVQVSLSSPSTDMVSVDFSTFDGTARSGCDYLTRFGNLEFEPGELVQTIQVPIVGDLAGEDDEDFMLLIGNPVGALISDAEGVVTVEDDDVSNHHPAAPSDRFPGNGATGIALDPILSWTSSDPDGDPVTHDVFFGTTFATDSQSWMELCAINAGPGPRAGAAAAYDNATDRLILFSGEAGPDFHPEDLWILANATAAGGPPTWFTLAPAAPAGGPVGRQQAAAAYDAATNRLILHGGCTADCDVALSDTWMLTNANGLGGTPAWIRLPDAPVSRKGAASAFDPARNRLMLFGGSQGDSGPDLDDVWVLKDANGIGTPEWEQLLPSGPTPSARANAAAAYDGATNRFIVFGGRQATDQVLNDTWVLSGANGLDGTPHWTELAGASPAPRWGHSGIYDEGARRFVVFGGTSAGLDDDLNFVANDLWMLTNADGTAGSPEWIQLAPENGPPLGRLLAASAYSPTRNRVALVSGKNNRAFLADDLIEDHWVLANAVGRLPLVSADQPGT
ncbi:MAG: Kelch repeat-containing protein, partial [Vicinamibacteria bacterium]